MLMRHALRSALALALAGTPAVADVWDTAVDSDDNVGTDNTPIHGTIQVHDLGVRPGPVTDQDWYSFEARGFASYEAVIDGLTGDTGGSLGFQFLAANGTSVLSSGTSLGSASCTLCTQTLRFENNQAAPRPLFVRVSAPGCGTACNSADQYTIRFHETTYAVPRYNNVGAQVTVLVLHNVSELPVTGTIHLFDTAGVRVGSQAVSLPVNNHVVVNTSAIAGGAGTSGVATISHNGRYGALAGKAVVLDPSTGFSFDTPFIAKP
jgi:hypothetical protein